MSLLHNLSKPAIRSQVDLFSIPSTDTTCDYSVYSEYQPSVNVQDCNSKLEFKIGANSTQYLDLNDSFLYLKVKVVNKKDGSNIAVASKLSTSNLFLHSLFSQLDVYFNSKLISTSNNAYPYRAYIETLLSYGLEYKASQATCPLFYLDTNNGKPGDNNKGYKKRGEFISGSKSVELVDKLRFDLANQHRYILNDINVTINLTKSSDAFALWAESETTTSGTSVAIKEYKIQILNATLFIRKQILFPSIILAHQKLLEKGEVARYPHKRIEVKYLTLPSGNSNLIEDNLFTNVIPSRVIIGFIKSKAFNGDLYENPYHFNHFSISNIGLSVNNIYLPSQPRTYDFDHGDYLLAYYSTFTSLGLIGQDVGLTYDRDSFKESNALFIFDIIQASTDDSLLTLDKSGNVKLEVKFGKPLTEALHCIVYAEYQSVLEIDKYRQIIVST